MDALDADVTQEDVVRLVLLRTEDDQDPLHELQTQKYKFGLQYSPQLVRPDE